MGSDIVHGAPDRSIHHHGRHSSIQCKGHSHRNDPTPFTPAHVTFVAVNTKSVTLKTLQSNGNTMPTFTFLRHAEATHNADNRRRGSIAYRDMVNRDAALTPKGHTQTQLALQRFVNETYDVIYCSPLQRCRQTLLGVYPAAAQLPVRLDDRLMEPQGDHTCNWRIEKDELAGSVPACWELAGVGALNPCSPNHNENGADFAARIKAWTDEVTTRHPNARILVVTHYMWSLWWHKVHRGMGMPIELSNCEAVVVDWSPPKKVDLAAAGGLVTPTDDNDDEL
jgi:broad specificity phosphatase PhoE